MIQSFVNFNSTDSSTWGSPVISVGEMYGPRALGETGEAVYDIANSAKQLVEDSEFKRDKKKKDE